MNYTRKCNSNIRKEDSMDNQNNFSSAPQPGLNGQCAPLGNRIPNQEMMKDTCYSQSPCYPLSKLKPQRLYDGKDRLFSVIALILGFALVKVLMNCDYGFGLLTSIFFLGLTFFNYSYCKKCNLDIFKESKFLFAVSLILSLLFTITDNESVKNINFCLVTVTNLYFVYSTYHSNNDSIVLNAFRSIIVSPFSEYGSIFGALFHKTSTVGSSEKDKKAKNALSILIGLLLSIPVTLVAAVVLMSSDSNFMEIYHKISDWIFDNMFMNIVILVFSIPFGMYIFSAVYSRAYRKENQNKISNPPKPNLRLFPAPTCNAFLTPLCVLYIIYILTQISYFLKTLGNVTEGFDYSDYARNGFFELCFIAVLNLAVASLVMFFVKLDEKRLPPSVRVFVVCFSVLTLSLIITATAKMIMYIDFYGMTPLRINTSVFMMYMFILFVILIVKQFKFEISFTKIAYTLAVIVIIAMSLLPVDLFIAKYNINAYLNDDIEWMGASAMYQLDSSALGEFIKFHESSDNLSTDKPENYSVKSQVTSYFDNTHSELQEIDIYNFNLSRCFASLSLDDYYSRK